LGFSKTLKSKFELLTESDKNRLIRMGWEDRSTFEAIEKQFGINPNEFVKFMRQALDAKTFKRWRARVFDQGKLKNEIQRGFKTTRFKCSRQSWDGLTKGWK
jgi:uncharacterized protein (TIGR03643 family)